MKYEEIVEKALNKEPINFDEAMYLYNNVPLSQLISLADRIRYIHNPEKKVTWQIDRNVNYANTCISGCLFCNFHCKPHEINKAFELKIEDYYSKIDELKSKGGSQLLLQGGLHPNFDIHYYETLFRALKDYEPSLKLNALGPPEVAHIARISNLSIHDTLLRLQKAGLDTLPGAGAEILCERVRKLQSPVKPSVEKWIEVMKEAHQMGFSTTATMVYGSIETTEERIQHFFTIRDIQDSKDSEIKDCDSKNYDVKNSEIKNYDVKNSEIQKKSNNIIKNLPINDTNYEKQIINTHVGFRSFILWPMQMAGTELGKRIAEGKIKKPQTKEGLSEYLRLIALARIILNNIPHIQASWLTVGTNAAQLALHAGADDLGSIMIEENVVASTGLKNRLDAQRMQDVIKEAGFTPQLRDQNYNKLI